MFYNRIFYAFVVMLHYNIEFTLQILYFLGLHPHKKRNVILFLWFCMIYSAFIIQMFLEMMMFKGKIDIFALIDVLMVMTYTSYVSHEKIYDLYVLY